MEAKETVIKTHNPQILPGINQHQIELLHKQADNSFKAGIREVVEWIEDDKYEVNQGTCLLGSIPVFLVHKEKWQAKLKDWGIE